MIVSDMKLLSTFFDVFLFLLSRLDSRSRFTAISLLVLEFLFIRDLTRNPENEETTLWNLPNIWGLDWIKDTECGMDVSNEWLLKATKWYALTNRVEMFYLFYWKFVFCLSVLCAFYPFLFWIRYHLYRPFI